MPNHIPLPVKAIAICILIFLSSFTTADTSYSNVKYGDTDQLENEIATQNVSLDGIYPLMDLFYYWDTTSLDPYKIDLKCLGGALQLPVLESDCGFALPFTGKVTSQFGWRWGRPHAGIDIDLNTGDTVVSAFDGVVRLSMWYSGYGHCVIVRHHNGIETLYGHLSKRLVNSGDMVNAGQILGLGGSTGHSTGSHLHFETRFMGKAFNPANLIDFASDSLLKDTLVFDTTSFGIPKPVYTQSSAYYKKGGKYYKKKSYSRKSSAYRRKK